MLECGDLEERHEALGLVGADRAAREAVLDQAHPQRAAGERAAAGGDVARAVSLRLEVDGGRERRDAGRAHSASATTTSGWRAARPVPCSICARQLVPAAAMTASPAART